MAILKLSTVYARKFLMVLTSDHITGATGKTVTVELSKGAGAAGSAAAGAVTELDSSNLPGVYQVALTANDTNALGDLWLHCTASACDPTDFCDQVQTNIFTDLNLSGAGLVSITSNVKQNQALNGFTFLMTSATTGQALTGLTVTAQRSLGEAGFAPCANSVTELSNGIYSINLAATDLNAATVMFRATATGANDQDILLITQP